MYKTVFSRLHLRSNMQWINRHFQRKVSYVHGSSAQPLLGTTIGNLLHKRTSEHPDREAVIVCHQQTKLTFEELLDKSDQLAAGLQAIGVRKGDRVGIWSPNCIEWVQTQYATARAGMILVNINPAYQVRELKHAMQKVGINTVIAAERFKTQDYYRMLTEVCPELESSVPGDIKSKSLPALKSVIMLSEHNLRGTFHFKDIMALASDKDKRSLMDLQKHLQFDDPINIQFTSGTTGNPKGATLSHHNIVNNSFFVGTTLKYHEKESRVCIPVPLYHCFGMVLGSLTNITCGTTTVFPSGSFEAVPSLQAVHDHRCTSLYGTPTMFIDMLAVPDLHKYDLTSLHTGIMAGSPCPIEVMKQVREKLHMPDVTICYGTTENSPVTFQSTMDTPVEKRVSTVGRVHPHTEAKVVDADGKILPRNEKGELWIRGYSVMLNYWEDEAKTKEVIGEDRWYRTGDIAIMDEQGYCSIVGRIKDLIIRGGENIYPTEIENFLFTHPKVEAVQVVGIPDDRLGEEVCAWIKLKVGQTCTEDEIKQFCKGQISHFKIPKHVLFVKDFPMTVTNKVQKFIMRDKSVEMLFPQN